MKRDKENSTGLSSDHAKLPEIKCISGITGNPRGIARSVGRSSTTVFLPVNEHKFNY